MSRYLQDYSEETIIKVLKSYLIYGDSHRSIQKNILKIPAPARGGGFIAMDILHYYDVKAEHKGILTSRNGFTSNSHMLSEAIAKINEFNTLKIIANESIEKNDITEFERSPTTEIDVITKQRIGQSALRRYVMKNYSNTCALCNIHQEDLLVCSHIIPWSINIENRLNPSNAIILCSLHDGLFDKGYFSLDDNYKIILSKKSDSLIIELLNLCNFKLPVNNLPSLDFLRFHRKEVCKINYL